MARSKITENRDEKVKAQRLEFRLSKAQKDAIKSDAQKQGLDLSNYILKKVLPKSK
jgi:uncharacterized protein (DUF1778 family)